MPFSPHSTPKPSPLLALTAASIAGAFDHRWLARPVAALAAEHDVSDQRISRLRARLQPGFEKDLAAAIRRGRPPTVAPEVVPSGAHFIRRGDHMASQLGAAPSQPTTATSGVGPNFQSHAAVSARVSGSASGRHSASAGGSSTT